MSIALRSCASRTALILLLCVVAFAGCENSDVKTLREAGFDVSGLKTENDVARKVADIEAVRSAISNEIKLAQLGPNESTAWVREAYSMGRVKGGGDARIASFGEELQRSDKATFDSKFAGQSTVDKARLMAQMEGRAFAGGAGAGGLLANYAVPESLGVPAPLDTSVVVAASAPTGEVDLDRCRSACFTRRVHELEAHGENASTEPGGPGLIDRQCEIDCKEGRQ
jgi:hypothetical protein